MNLTKQPIKFKGMIALRRIVFIILNIIIVATLTGCLYPNAHENVEQKIPNEEMLTSVQRAMEQFREENNGILPIKTKEHDTDIYIKYLIDFHKLVPSYLNAIPANAFEKGGIYQYVIIDPETTPEVKIFDLKIAEVIRDIQFRLTMKQYPPYQDRLSKQLFSLNFKELGYKEEPVIISPYTGQNLSLVISGAGTIYVDYRSDLYLKAKEVGKEEIKSGEDLRYLLSIDSPFVPAYSFPMTIDENGDPQFLDK
ncbi:hypothetical protein [Bacillus kwashiorkori]|uniref:hypothetical protein n=1 Tax=Bacillus kwashiorkori TaxID=1522318 RepID=UPI001EF0D6FD|nr:hypothetical protein [Bacillus kwashiorkori]